VVVLNSDRMVFGLMRYRYPIDIPPRDAVLILCTLALVVLVYTEGWIWPLKAAACMIPVSLLIG
jgi:hypothetical protein